MSGGVILTDKQACEAVETLRTTWSDREFSRVLDELLASHEEQARRLKIVEDAGNELLYALKRGHEHEVDESIDLLAAALAGGAD